MVPNEASEEDFDELKKYFDEGQIVEIMAAIALSDADATSAGGTEGRTRPVD
jgi:alkylhydroperoxidase family enzyme